MEKDYFLDRPVECQQRSSIKKATEAFICRKSAQKTATILGDLTRINITTILTPGDTHPRGIKLKGYVVPRDCYGNIVISDDGSIVVKEAVGRCTYPIINRKVLTLNGYRDIAYIDDNLTLIDVVQEDLYSIVAVFKGDRFSVEALTSPYCYEEEKNLHKILSTVDFTNAFAKNRYVYAQNCRKQNIALEINSVKGEIIAGSPIKLIGYYGIRQTPSNTN